MNDLSNIFKRCIDERITILTGRSSRADRSQLNSSMIMSRVKTKDNHCQNLDANLLNKYDVELAYETELEYRPRFLVKQRDRSEVMSDFSDAYELPKLSLLDHQPIKKNSMGNSQHDSSGLTSRKNTYNKFKSFSTRLKAMKLGYLAIDPDSPHSQELFKQLSCSNIYQEITKPQLVNYLVKSLGCQPSVLKLINSLQIPYSMTLSVFRGLLLQIREMTQQQIIMMVFNAYDILSKTFLNTRDLFELFKCGGAAQKDADIMFRYLRFSQIKKPFDLTQTVTPKKQDKKKKQKSILITMMKEKQKKWSDIYQRSLKQDGNIINAQIFMDIYQNTIPEFFKTLVLLIANYNCD